MASLQSKPELTNRLRIAESLSRNIVVLPPDRESFFWGPETASENVIQGIQIVSPREQLHRAINLVVKLFQSRETLTVDLVNLHIVES